MAWGASWASSTRCFTATRFKQCSDPVCKTRQWPSHLDAPAAGCSNGLMPNVNDRYKELVRTLKEITALDSCASLLSWDEQTFMPKKGAELRAEQASLLARMSHEKFTHPWIGEMLRELEGSELMRERHSDSEVNIR